MIIHGMKFLPDESAEEYLIRMKKENRPQNGETSDERWDRVLAECEKGYGIGDDIITAGSLD